MTDSNYTHVLFILDRSGSMDSIVNDANGGVETLLKEQAEQPGKIAVDVVTFDTLLDWPYENVHPSKVKGPLIVPRGGTALNDAIGVGVVKLGEYLAALPEEKRPGAVIVVIVTDGEENSSREYTHAMVKELVTKQTNEFGWNFVYLAANVDAFATGAGYGISKGSTMNFAPSAAGVTNSYAATSRNISGLRTSMSAGITGQTITFDDTDRDEAMEE